MYIPGRFRTGSRPFKTWMEPAPYVSADPVATAAAAFAVFFEAWMSESLVSDELGSLASAMAPAVIVEWMPRRGARANNGVAVTDGETGKPTTPRRTALKPTRCTVGPHPASGPSATRAARTKERPLLADIAPTPRLPTKREVVSTAAKPRLPPPEVPEVLGVAKLLSPTGLLHRYITQQRTRCVCSRRCTVGFVFPISNHFFGRNVWRN